MGEAEIKKSSWGMICQKEILRDLRGFGYSRGGKEGLAGVGAQFDSEVVHITGSREKLAQFESEFSTVRRSNLGDGEESEENLANMGDRWVKSFLAYFMNGGQKADDHKFGGFQYAAMG